MFETLPAGTELRVWGTPPDERDGRDKILRGGLHQRVVWVKWGMANSRLSAVAFPLSRIPRVSQVTEGLVGISQSHLANRTSQKQVHPS